MKKTFIFVSAAFFISMNACVSATSENQVKEQEDPELVQDIHMDSLVKVEKDFLYDQYTLGDSYPYKNTTRIFQWDKIKARLALIDTYNKESDTWGYIQNYKDRHGSAPVAKNAKQDEYNSMVDSYNVLRYQSAPLYAVVDLKTPERYCKDGSLVKVIEDNDRYYKVSVAYFPGEWMVPKKYIKLMDSGIKFKIAIFVDRTNQNIMSLEKVGEKWLVRSMNPATTGLHKPPYQRVTPLGIFALQEKATEFKFYKDGTTEIGGFAPWANRFSGGAYMHGVPVNLPSTKIIEFSPTLGTTPRSHMCVRNATSHAKFLYDWAPVEESLVFVIE